MVSPSSRAPARNGGQARDRGPAPLRRAGCRGGSAFPAACHGSSSSISLGASLFVVFMANLDQFLAPSGAPITSCARRTYAFSQSLPGYRRFRPLPPPISRGSRRGRRFPGDRPTMLKALTQDRAFVFFCQGDLGIVGVILDLLRRLLVQFLLRPVAAAPTAP